MSRPVRPSLFSEFVFFLKEYKKWWLTPIFAVIALMIILIISAGSGGAPFIYTLF